MKLLLSLLLLWACPTWAAPPCNWQHIAAEEMVQIAKVGFEDRTLWEEAARGVGAAANALEITFRTGADALVFDPGSFADMALFRQTGRPGSFGPPFSGAKWGQLIQRLYDKQVAADAPSVQLVGHAKGSPLGKVTWHLDPKSRQVRYGQTETPEGILQLILPLESPTLMVDHRFDTPLADALVLTLSQTSGGRWRVKGARPLTKETPNDAGNVVAREAFGKAIERQRQRVAELKELQKNFHPPFGVGEDAELGLLLSSGMFGATASLLSWATARMFGATPESAEYIGLGAFFVPMAALVRAHVQDYLIPTARIKTIAREEKILAFLEREWGQPLPSPVRWQRGSNREDFARPVNGHRIGAPDYRPYTPPYANYLREHSREMTSHELDRMVSIFRRAERVINDSEQRKQLMNELRIQTAGSRSVSEFAAAYSAADRYLTKIERARGLTYSPLPIAELFRLTTGSSSR